MKQDLSNERRSYERGELTEQNAARNPFAQFNQWFEEMKQGDFLEPNTMVLATSSANGKPSARMVLLKGFSEEGFVFYTNYHSRKGNDLGENPQAALLFYWDILERQVRIEGAIKKVHANLSEEYFASRPFESQLSAIVSEQSEVIPNREFLEEKLEALKQQGRASRPEHWGGYIVKPSVFEFWQGRPNRLHDRIVYERAGDAWVMKRLAP